MPSTSSPPSVGVSLWDRLRTFCEPHAQRRAPFPVAFRPSAPPQANYQRGTNSMCLRGGSPAPDPEGRPASAGHVAAAARRQDGERLVEKSSPRWTSETVTVPGTEAAALIVPSLAESLAAVLDQRKLLAGRIEAAGASPFFQSPDVDAGVGVGTGTIRSRSATAAFPTADGMMGQARPVWLPARQYDQCLPWGVRCGCRIGAARASTR